LEDLGQKKHNEETKKKISDKVVGFNNPRAYDLSEEDVLKIGKEFIDFFVGKISEKKWIYWCNNIKKISPSIRKSFRFNNEDLFSILVKKYGCIILHDALLWFHDPTSKLTKRCFDWEYEIDPSVIPENFVRGRGKESFKKTKKLK
jgi:hypothetical protein